MKTMPVTRGRAGVERALVTEKRQINLAVGVSRQTRLTDVPVWEWEGDFACLSFPQMLARFYAGIIPRQRPHNSWFVNIESILAHEIDREERLLSRPATEARAIGEALLREEQFRGNLISDPIFDLEWGRNGLERDPNRKWQRIGKKGEMKLGRGTRCDIYRTVTAGLVSPNILTESATLKPLLAEEQQGRVMLRNETVATEAGQYSIWTAVEQLNRQYQGLDFTLPPAPPTGEPPQKGFEPPLLQIGRKLFEAWRKVENRSYLAVDQGDRIVPVSSVEPGETAHFILARSKS